MQMASLKSESWLALPGMSHFLFYSDEGGSSLAPSGLGLLSAGIAFCFITQIARYIENMKLNVDGVRLVQKIPFSLLEGTFKDTLLEMRNQSKHICFSMDLYQRKCLKSY
jgi:hypothetical protein